MDDDAILRQGVRAVLLWWRPEPAARRLGVLPSPAWSDGEGIWLTADDAAGDLRRPPPALLLLPPAPAGSPAALVRGELRAYGLHDPLGLALHGAAVATAMSALALRGAGALLRSWPRLLPPTQLALRFVVQSVEPLGRGEPADGVAPALPPVVPSPVRRALAGERDVLAVLPRLEDSGWTRWGAGFALEESRGPRERMAVVADSGGAQGEAAGLALEGPLGADGRLRPERAAWWSDGRVDEADVPASPATIVLPD